MIFKQESLKKKKDQEKDLMIFHFSQCKVKEMDILFLTKYSRVNIWMFRL